MNFGDPLEASWGSLGSLLEASWAPLGAVWAPLGALLGRSWAFLGCSWGSLGALWVLLGALGVLWGCLGALLGRFWVDFWLILARVGVAVVDLLKPLTRFSPAVSLGLLSMPIYHAWGCHLVMCLVAGWLCQFLA